MPEQIHADQPANVLEPVLTAAQKQFQGFREVQSELAQKAMNINQYWMDRGRYEAKTASEFASRLATVHSIPEAMTAWQEWSKSRLERMVDDGKHLVADIQEVMKAAGNALPKSDA